MKGSHTTTNTPSQNSTTLSSTAACHRMGAQERMSPQIIPESRNGNAHESHQSQIQRPHPHYIPFSDVKSSAPSDTRPTSTCPTTALSPVCAHATTSSSSARTSSETHRESLSLGSGLSEARNGSEMEPDVLAVEEVCRELTKAAALVSQTGFGCPVTTLSQNIIS